MREFRELSKDEFIVNEKKYIDYWNKIDILNKSIDKGKDYWVFYDGPAFANGFPGLHHMVAKNLKDIVCKYQTMLGNKVIRKIGWDTHGLPIENHVEKKLGLKTKKDIEALGIEKFNQECRNSIRENEQAFTDLTHKMGQFIDTDNPYLTYKNEYIETEWYILSEFYKKGYFYEGTKVTPYCPRCGTGLASHEVAQGYKSVDTNTVIVPFKIKDKDEYFLVWTTTPWTLLSNVALCVNPKEDYVKVKLEDNVFILAKALKDKVVGEDAKVISTFKGSELEYTKYEQLLPFIKVDGNAFFVTCDEYVTMEDGTGIVHMAPAFGEDDSRVGKLYDLAYVNPVDLDGTYTDGPWKNILVFDADIEIIKYLKENNKLFKKQKITHDYPHCWRCDSPLIYYTMPSYYIAVSKFRDKLVEANSKVNWYPDYVGSKRFNNWLENAKDWAVSRTRYWGAPIPYYKCSCGHNEMIGSISELREKATVKIDDNLDLHKPYIDNIYLKCPKCGKDMKRIPDVLDCWFDSGSMPFAQYHYPFENKELWESQFPADFICEGIDQTRGWFYTLLVISTFLKGCAPYKNVLVNDLLLDKDGKKMSKSRGNIVEPFTTMKEYGADTVRFYLPYISPVWTPLKFDINGLKEVYSKFFNPLKNTYSFFVTYANIDKIDTDMFNIEYKDLDLIDKWLLSKYNKLLKNVTNYYNSYDLNKVARCLTSFVSEDLSNWYIRRNRERFWSSKIDNSKISVYQTTYQVLVGLSQVIAPITPFISEEIYQNLTLEQSVHLSSFPKYNDKLIDTNLEEKMDLVRDLISIGRNVREEVKIKVRQPIKEIIIDNKYKKLIGNLESLIKEELNVKEVNYATDLDKYMNIEYRPNYKVCGKIFGSNMKDFTNYLLNISNEDINKLNNNQLSININNTLYDITKDMIDIKISSKEGYDVSTVNNLFVILNTNLDKNLINEGLARETVSKIQNLRKTSGFDIEDRINIYMNATLEYQNDIKNYIDMIKDDTLCINLVFDNDIKDNQLNINDYVVYVKLEKNEK